MHEQVNFSCKHCNCDATTKGNLEEHQKSLHEVKMSKFLVHIELMKLLQMDHLQKFMRESFIYPCKHCSYKVNQNGELKGHQKSVHERVEYIFKHCSYKATMIRNKCMKESNFLVHIAHMKQLQMDHL